MVGGSAVYQAALEHADVLVVTEVDLVVDAPAAARAPVVGPGWQRTGVGDWATSTAGPRFRIGTWRRAG